jgi:hypothetical protein
VLQRFECSCKCDARSGTHAWTLRGVFPRAYPAEELLKVRLNESMD